LKTIASIESIVCRSSWASGANLWGHEKDEKFSRPTHYDGMLEVVGVTGIVHLGQIQSGIRSAVRLAQGGHVRFTNDYSRLLSLIEIITHRFIYE
jgi:hypothetical protein